MKKRLLLNLKENTGKLKIQRPKNNLVTKIYYSIVASAMQFQLAFAEAATKKPESNVILQKFGLAIFLVIFFALIIYLLLSLYKKVIMTKEKTKINYPSTDSLEPAKNINEAIQIFLEKTKPNQ